ncbi:MAG: inositol monophosphatase [Candidatus Levybacteria bacterium]|nr:inositol monophosphatase [Candidatus Levybacteria bacterium]
MINLQKEKEFFERVSVLVFNFLSSLKQKTLTIRYKHLRGVVLDPVTSSDIAIENLISKEIIKLFPNDKVLGEENSSDLIIDPKVRTWIIDPICGTTNYARGIKNFCTNISLAYQDIIIAACVLDHAREEFIWSIGNKEIYINDSLTKEINRSVPLIDVDLGGSYYLQNAKAKRKYTNFLYRILIKSDYMTVSYNTSLGFAYAGAGRLDGYFVIAPHIWDVATANFLLIQSGGIVSDISGKSWNLNSKSVLAARDKAVHEKLLNLYLDS